MGALDTAVRQGKALYAGISSYSAGRTRDAARILRELGTPLLIHQPSYSMFNRWIEGELLDTLEREGVGCIAFSPLAQGLLTSRYLDGVPAGSRAATGRFMDEGFLTRRAPGARARPERARGRPRADARADGDRVGPARPAGDLRADRREQRPAARGLPRRAGAASTSAPRSWRPSTSTPSTPASTSGRRRARTERRPRRHAAPSRPGAGPQALTPRPTSSEGRSRGTRRRPTRRRGRRPAWWCSRPARERRAPGRPCRRGGRPVTARRHRPAVGPRRASRHPGASRRAGP